MRNRGGTGSGMEGPPVRGPAGPRFPLLPAATPPRQGRGLRPVRRWSKGWRGRGLCMGCYLVPVPVSRVRQAARLGRRGGPGLARARGWRPAAEAEAAPCRCGARGGRGVVWAGRPAAGGCPGSPTPWGRRARRGHARRAGQAVGGARARASARPMQAPLRAAGPAAWAQRGLGAEAGARRVGSGGRPRWKRRHAGARPVAAAGRRGRTGRLSVAALRAPLHGVGWRAGGTCAAQVRLRGARVQGRRRAR